jgi:serine phosphatase RsbU (regulator of sigma subunit)
VLDLRESPRSLVDVTAAGPAPVALTPNAQAPRARPATRFRRSGLAVLLVGLLTTALVSWLCYRVNDHDEAGLLELQTKQTGTVLQAVIPTIQTPLASAAEIAATSRGDQAAFRSYMSVYVGAGKSFVSASLWPVDGSTALVTVGQASILSLDPVRAQNFRSATAHASALSVMGLLGGTTPRLAYGYSSSGADPLYVVTAETALPPGRRATVAAGSPFADLHFALYLGHSASPDALLESNAPVPISGRKATVTVPFGNNSLTLVATPANRLGGALGARLWWTVALIGAIFAVAAGLAAERLGRGQVAAQRLAHDVQQLLSEQRTIAEALQRSLLPHKLLTIPGVRIQVRYLPGVNNMEIGGDWYDVIALDERRFFFVIGDVSGRGLGAGTVMASLLFAIRGFVSEGHSPTIVLEKLNGVLRTSRDRHFATLLCGVGNAVDRTVTIANAGHLPALLIDDDQARFLSAPPGPPVGVTQTAHYELSTEQLPPNATLVLYTDGLVERRDEDIDQGLERLRHVSAGTNAGSLDDLLTNLTTEVAQTPNDDDTAIIAFRWETK